MNIRQIKEKSIDKIVKTASCIKDAPPYTTQGGKYDDLTESRAHWWTNSFWAGILRQMYDVTGDKVYADYAIGCEKKLESLPDSPQYIQTHIGVGYRMMKVE